MTPVTYSSCLKLNRRSDVTNRLNEIDAKLQTATCMRYPHITKITCIYKYKLPMYLGSTTGHITASTWLPHWSMPAHGRLWSTDIMIIRMLSLYCTTLQQHVQWTIIQCGWPTSVKRLAQRSLQYQSSNQHFWQTSQNATVFYLMRLPHFCSSWIFMRHL